MTLAKDITVDEVLQLMWEVDYDGMPDEEEAREILSSIRHVGVRRDDGKLMLWVGFRGGIDVQLAIACHPDWQKRWASRDLIREVFREAFHRGAERLWVYTDRIQMALTVGLEREYNPATPRGLTYMEMTREEYERKLDMRGKSI